MCSTVFSPVSSRKNRHGGTEKLCLLTGMRGSLVGDVAGLWTNLQLPSVLALLRP